MISSTTLKIHFKNPRLVNFLYQQKCISGLERKHISNQNPKGRCPGFFRYLFSIHNNINMLLLIQVPE